MIPNACGRRAPRLEHRERYHPTDAVEAIVRIDPTGRPVRRARRRRRRAARWWDELTDAQRHAAIRIDLAWRALCGETLTRAMILARAVRTPWKDDGPWLVSVLRDYRAWRRRLRAEGVRADAVMMALVEGATLEQVERSYRRRPGDPRRWARAGIVRTLDLYASSR